MKLQTNLDEADNDADGGDDEVGGPGGDAYCPTQCVFCDLRQMNE